VEVQNARGHSAGLSNQVMVPLAPTLPPPSRLSARVTAEGVAISASGEHGPVPPGLTFAYHLYRRNQGAQQEMDLGKPSAHPVSGRNYTLLFLDRDIEWEQTYLYKIAAVTVETVQGKEEQVQGDDSPEVQVFVHDVFPPAPPTGLQAVYSGTPQQPFIDLSWAPNTESDLAGYNVYRHEEGQVAAKINTGLVKVPTYRDTAVQPGRRYVYSVTAVDVRGNESGQSAEATETVPE
jgi:fibronectin type 3 domain-containing protein